jgi:hypothetical protein
MQNSIALSNVGNDNEYVFTFGSTNIFVSKLIFLFCVFVLKFST